MNSEKLKQLRALGWKVGSAEDFLGLTEAEAHVVARKLSLARNANTAIRTVQTIANTSTP